MRPRQDVASDGSQIEGSHKGWNGLQRSYASGLDVLNALSHDHVLRRNVRIGLRRSAEDRDPFLVLTYGSHHVRLVDGIAKLWNLLVGKIRAKTNRPISHKEFPELRIISSDENFGIVSADYIATYQNLLQIKEEPEEAELFDLSSDESVAAKILHDLRINPAELSQPAQGPKTASSTAASGTAELLAQSLERAHISSVGTRFDQTIALPLLTQFENVDNASTRDDSLQAGPLSVSSRGAALLPAPTPSPDPLVVSTCGDGCQVVNGSPACNVSALDLGVCRVTHRWFYSPQTQIWKYPS